MLTEPAMKGSDDSELQQKLLSLNIEHADEEPGVFGSMTVLTMKDFQRKFVFETNGTVRQAEWNALFAPNDIMARFIKDIAIVNGNSNQDSHLAQRVEVVPQGPYFQAHADWFTDGHVLKKATLFAQESAARFSAAWHIALLDDRRIYFQNYINSDTRMTYSMGQNLCTIRDGVANEVNLKERGVEHLAWAVSTVSDLARKQQAAVP